MRKRLILPILVTLLALVACNASGRQGGQRYLEELSTQDFEIAYELGKAFLNDFYAHKAGRRDIDFTLYISNGNLLKYSSKRMSVETYVYDIKEVFIGLNQARFIREEKCYYLNYAVYAKHGPMGESLEEIEMLISADGGNPTISDWYIACGKGISSFDQHYRPNASINSPDVWNKEEFVKAIFEKAGIE